MELEDNQLRRTLRLVGIVVTLGLFILFTILAPDPTGLSWPIYLLSPLFMVASILSVIAYAVIAGLAISSHRYNLELHSRTAAVISMICCILYIGGNVIWGLSIWEKFVFDNRYLLPIINIGFWLLYFGTMQALRQAQPLRRIKIGLAVTLPVLFLAFVGLYVNLVTIFSPQGYHGYTYSSDYLAFLLINTILLCALFGLLWEPIRQRFVTPVGSTNGLEPVAKI